MDNVILYSNHCVKCDILKEILDNKNIKYFVEDNIEKLKELNFTHMPMLKVDDKILNFKEAFSYLSGGNN